jgi:hypothetical protein
MHKYKEQNVPCGGTDAQGISGSIHTRHLVYVRCSRTQLTQADVRSAVPRTALVTRNSISVGRADGASTVARTLPKNLIAHTPVQVSLCGRQFRRPALPQSLCLQKVGWEWLCATRLRLYVRTVLSTPEAASPPPYIYMRRGRPTNSNSCHQSYRYSQAETDAISDVCY